MSTALSFIGFIVLIIIVITSCAFVVVCIHYLVLFHWRSCKHCKHNMVYRGVMNPVNSQEEYHAFQCPKCGTWEYVSKAELLCQEEILNKKKQK